MSKRNPGAYERRERDHYATPFRAAARLAPWLLAEGITEYAEPCRGKNDLVFHLSEASGGKLRCVWASDITDGIDARELTFAWPVITNPPYQRKVMHSLLAHFLASAPLCWLLLEADWLHTKQARPFLPHCSDVVSVGRLRWIEGSRFTSLDNYAWLRFCADHSAGPKIRVGDPPLSTQTLVCQACGHPFEATRRDAKFCGPACKQKIWRRRLSVTPAVTEIGVDGNGILS